MGKKLLLSLIAASTLASALHAEVLATVNGETITKEDIDVITRQMTQGQKSFDDIPAEYRQKVIESAVAKRLLTQHALKSGVEKDDDFKKMMEMAKGDIAFQVWQRQLIDQIQVSESDAKAFYKENLQTLTRPEQARASNIQVSSEEEAKKILADLKKAPKKELAAKFAEAAKQHSTGPRASEGGDLGYFGRDQMLKEISDVAFSLKAGEMVKEPLKTSFGYHLIYLAEKQDAGTVPFKEVKDQMFEGAKAKKFKETMEKKIAELTKKAKIDYKK